ncbi:DciA family protein [Streptomyces hydrogenans]|uniref:DciA family protein n=1 Tax=Streptomyces hydrogenans TaxID=1873719 RepID=UPI0036EFDB10
MTDTPADTGADLARQALNAARAAAKRHGSTPRATTRRRPAARGADGRDPVSFGAALTRLVDERGWNTGVHGGNILDRWTELCPQYENRVHAVAYDPDTGRLDVRPVSPAYATQLRLLGGQLCRQINEKLGADTVRSIRILAPRETPFALVRDPAPAREDQARTPAAPARDTAPRQRSAGYQRALDAHRSVYRPYDDPAATQAVERQLAALRTNRLPDEEHAEYRYLLEQEAEQRQREAPGTDASLRAALRYKHTGQTTNTATGQRPTTGVA